MTHNIKENLNKKSKEVLLECDCGWSYIADVPYAEAIKGRHIQITTPPPDETESDEDES